MARPVCNRVVNSLPVVSFFKPQGIPMQDLEIVQLTVDELESVRLADLQGLYQETAAAEMQVSRQTFGRILDSAHRKIADALVTGKSLRIDGGQYLVKGKRTFTCKHCRRRYQNRRSLPRAAACPRCELAIARKKLQSDTGKDGHDD